MPPETKIPNNKEIDQALKEFEAKAKDVPQGGAAPVTSSGSDEMPRMVRLVIKLSGGAIKEQKQAEYVLLGIAAVAIAISIYLFFGRGNQASSIPPDVFIYTPQPTTSSN